MAGRRRVALGRYNDEFNLSKGAILQEVAYLSYPAAKGIGGMTSAVDALNQRFETLKGKAESVLSGSLTLDGINVDAMGQDRTPSTRMRVGWRRLRMRGLRGRTGLASLRLRCPTLPRCCRSPVTRAAAAQLLADFQDGLVPQLLDPEAAKEKVRRMLLGDQNMAAMAQQIAQELSKKWAYRCSRRNRQRARRWALSKDGEAGTSVLDGTMKAIALWMA